jgi:hypothetical protein
MYSNAPLEKNTVFLLSVWKVEPLFKLATRGWAGGGESNSNDQKFVILYLLSYSLRW